MEINSTPICRIGIFSKTACEVMSNRLDNYWDMVHAHALANMGQSVSAVMGQCPYHKGTNLENKS